MAQAAQRLTEKGLEAFRVYLAELRKGSTARPPRSLLTDPEASEPFSSELFVEERTFRTRLEVARYLCHLFDDIRGVAEDIGLWSWLSLFFFDEVCPAGADGRREPGRDYRHILEPGYPHGHRHLLGGAFLVYALHGEDAALLLATKPHQESVLHHELASRQVLISNREIVRAASLLYLDPRTGTPKRGAQDPTASPGTIRRLVDLLQQLDLNYDLYGMKAEAIIQLLPPEFDAWRQKTRFGFRGRVPAR